MCIATGEIKRPMKEKALLASLMSQGEQILRTTTKPQRTLVSFVSLLCPTINCDPSFACSRR